MQRFLGVVWSSSAQTPGQSGAVVVEANRLRIFVDHELLLDKAVPRLRYTRAPTRSPSHLASRSSFSLQNKANLRHWLDRSVAVGDATISSSDRPTRGSARRCANCGPTSYDSAADFCGECGQKLYNSPESVVLASLVQRVSELERKASTWQTNLGGGSRSSRVRSGRSFGAPSAEVG